MAGRLLQQWSTMRPNIPLLAATILYGLISAAYGDGHRDFHQLFGKFLKPAAVSQASFTSPSR